MLINHGKKTDFLIPILKDTFTEEVTSDPYKWIFRRISFSLYIVGPSSFPYNYWILGRKKM